MESLKLRIELGMDQAVVSNVLVQKNNNSIEMLYGTVAVFRNGNSRLVKVQYVIAVISEQHHSYRNDFANLQKSANVRNSCLQLLFL